MRILLAEDDVLIAQNIENALSYMGYEVVGPFDRGADAIKAFQTESIDIAILDMDLADDVSGYDIAKSAKEHQSVPIIFITALLDDTTRNKVTEVGAFAFLNKPFHERNLFNAIDLAISQMAEAEKKLELQNPIRPNKTYKINNKIFIKKQEKYVKVEVDDILFMEASGHYVAIQLKNSQVLANTHLTDLLEQINHPNLLRIHRSYAINLENTPDFDEVFMYFSQKNIPISRAYKNELRDRFKLI